MENIKLKKWVWRICLCIWNIFAVIGLAVSGYFAYLIFDEKGYCLSEQHGVWDNKQKICRTDCLKWDDKLGCLKE